MLVNTDSSVGRSSQANQSDSYKAELPQRLRSSFIHSRQSLILNIGSFFILYLFFSYRTGFKFSWLCFYAEQNDKKYNVKFLQYLKNKKTEVNVEIITFYILRKHKNAAGSALAGGNFWSNIFVIKN